MDGGHGRSVHLPEVKEDFYHREGTQILSAGQTFTTAYAIEVF